MAFHQFSRKFTLNALLEEVWSFIATPANLMKITPSSLSFEIMTPDLPSQMYEGLIIQYRVKPFAGIRTNWVSEITHIKTGRYFVDEQRIGPYKMWHHEHWLQPIKGGVEVLDIVSYQPPYGLIGRIANTWLIKQRLTEIFAYRQKAIINHFEEENKASR